MKKYDFDKAKQTIEANKENIQEASLGMHEDWFWTAETIFENGEYKRELMTNEDAEKMNNEYIEKRKAGMGLLSDEAEKYQSCNIAGICGSDWATPALHLQFNDGTEKFIECYIGESDVTEEEKQKQSELWAGGAMSSEVQKLIKPISKDL